jgi:hypothetical protein
LTTVYEVIMSVKNILKVFQMATQDEHCVGRQWYESAHKDARRLGVPIETAAGVIAAISPGLRWEVNIEAARRIIAGESLVGLGVRWSRNVRKAKAILAGRAPCDVLKGNKVRAFYACILAPSQCQSVCVDGHAFSIWKGKRIGLDKTPPIGNPLYRRISTDYAKAAKQVGLCPHQLQAIVWGVWRRLHVRKSVYQFQA